MKKIILLVVFCMLISLFAFNAVLANEPEPMSPIPFQSGDRVLFVGDSITHYGEYHKLIMEFYATRYPDRNIKIMNAGISGDNASGVLGRIASNIDEYTPTKVVVMIGMNDFSRSSSSEYLPTIENTTTIPKLNTYEDKISSITDIIIQKGVVPILIGPSAYDDTSTISASNCVGYSGMLASATKRVKKVALEKNGYFVDFNTPMNNLNHQMQQTNPLFTLCGSDRIHPAADGNMFMAYLFLKAQGFDKIVSDVEIDYSTLAVNKNTNALVQNVAKNSNVLSYIYTPSKLPIYCHASYVNVENMGIDISGGINNEIIKITNADTGKYTLKLNGAAAGTYTGTELREGINIAKTANHPLKTKLQEIRTLADAEYSTAYKICDYNFSVRAQISKGYATLQAYYDAEYAGMDQFNKNRLANAIEVAYTVGYNPTKAAIEQKYAEMLSAVSTSAITVELTKTSSSEATPSPSPTPYLFTPNPAKSIVYENFESFPEGTYMPSSTYASWNFPNVEAADHSFTIVLENNNKHLQIKRLNTTAAATTPAVSRSITPQTGIFALEFDIKVPEGTEQALVRLNGAKVSGGVVPFGLNLNSNGTLSAFNSPTNSDSGNIVTGLNAKQFQHVKVLIDFPRKVFKVYVNYSNTPAENPREITTDRESYEWDFRDASNVQWLNINSIDMTIGASKTAGMAGAFDNIWIYDPDEYPPPTYNPNETAAPTATPTSVPTLAPTPTANVQPTLSPAPGAIDTSKVIFYDNFENHATGISAIPNASMTNGWRSYCSVEASTTETEIVSQNGNKYMALKRKTASTANNMPAVEHSFTAQTGRMVVEADMNLPATDEDTMRIRLLGDGSGYPAIGINFKANGDLVAFNDPSGSASGIVSGVTTPGSFNHIKLDIDVAAQSYKIYINRNAVPLTNPRTGTPEWQFRLADTAPRTNLNKIDFCLAINPVYTAYFDNVIIYNPYIYVPSGYGEDNMSRNILNVNMGTDNFTAFNTINKSGAATVTTQIASFKLGTIAPKVVSAVYSGNKLVSLDVTSSSLPNGTYTSVMNEVDIPVTASGKLKIMVIGDFDNITPLLRSYEIPINNAS